MLALILVGVWLILASQGQATEGLTLAFGIAVTVLAALESPLGDAVRRR